MVLGLATLGGLCSDYQGRRRAGFDIGLAIAIPAAQQGYSTATCGIFSDGPQRAISFAGELSSSIHPFVCDTGVEDAMIATFADTLKLGTPNMLVNNAEPVAIGTANDFMEMSSAAFAIVHFPTSACLAASPDAGASIVNISSVVGPIFGGGGEWYSGAKAGIAGCTKNIAASLKGNVRVRSVAPGGPIRTPRNSKLIDEGVFAKILDRYPTGRPGTPEELANGIMFLLSPAASYIDGHILVIDGGLSIAEKSWIELAHHGDTAPHPPSNKRSDLHEQTAGGWVLTAVASRMARR